VISPLLANVYLHYVFDQWVHAWRRRNATGDVIVVRYADDIVVGFQHRQEAELFLQQWQNRLRQFGLELHPDKTRLLAFGRFAARDRERRGEGKPESFNFLGFTHSCGCTRKDGHFTVVRHTLRQRLAAKLQDIQQELRRRINHPVADVGKWLRAVVQGYFHYHAIPGNVPRLDSFRGQVIWLWMRALRRRSQRGRVTWRWFGPLVTRWIPSVRVLHPYPDVRFAATHPR